MAPDAFDATTWLDDFFQAYYLRRPVNATFIGVHEHDHRLPDMSEGGVGDTLAEMKGLLARVRDVELEELSPTDALDVRLARGFLRVQIWEHESGHGDLGNPSFYVSEAVFGAMSLFLNHGGTLEEREAALRQRLEAVPRLLAQARSMLEGAPAWWVERAMRECRGTRAFFGPGLDLLVEEYGLDHSALRRAGDAAFQATANYRHFLEQNLLPRAEGGDGGDAPESAAAGAEAFDLHLREAHFLEEGADEIVRYAEEEMARARSWLEAHAGDFGADSPEDALAALSELHPTPEGYYDRYREIWDDVRALVEEQGLLTWPAFPIRYVPRPRWSRRAAPHLYFLYYRSPAAYNRPPVHDHLVTPIDPGMPSETSRELLRANNDSVIKLNHVIHHGGVGHHVQNWHAFQSVSRVGRMAAVDCASRTAMLSAGTMAEGWACYATDLVSEAGGLTELEAYAEVHARVRMCARAVVDVRLHRNELSLAEAAEYYQEHAGMGAGAARKEVVKNSMFPGGAVMYLSGTDAIHRLRKDMARLQGNDFELRAFHDTFLSYGSVPVRLIADDMKAGASDAP